MNRSGSDGQMLAMYSQGVSPLSILEPAGEVVGGHGVGEVRLRLVAALIVEAFDSRLPDDPVHPLDLSVGPRMVWLGEAMLMLFASQIMSKRIRRDQAVLRLRGCSAN